VVAALAARLRGPAALTWALVALLYVVVFAFPDGMPLGIYAAGIYFGARAALVVIGIVLVYRSSRIINFAQVQVGIAGGLVFFLLVKFQVIVRGLDAGWGCASADGPPSWAVQLP
jgi:hypothetical protein